MSEMATLTTQTDWGHNNNINLLISQIIITAGGYYQSRGFSP